MKTKSKVLFVLSVSFFLLFALFTLLLLTVDVAPIGPQGSQIGLSGLNQAAREALGSSSLAYDISEILGLLCLGGAAAFALIALVQWIRRRSLRLVDRGLILLGGAYVLTVVFYALFEVVVINYRPVLINGVLEASYPSSTTLLATCVLPTAILQLNTRIKQSVLRRAVAIALAALTAFMVIGRLLSGVHWLTDIIGGALLSAGLVLLYAALCRLRKD